MTKKVSKKKLIVVTKDMNLAEVVQNYPDSAEVLMDYGLHCVGCHFNTMDSIEAGSKVHGLSDQDIDDMVIRINEVINFGE